MKICTSLMWMIVTCAISHTGAREIRGDGGGGRGGKKGAAEDGVDNDCAALTGIGAVMIKQNTTRSAASGAARGIRRESRRHLLHAVFACIARAQAASQVTVNAGFERARIPPDSTAGSSCKSLRRRSAERENRHGKAAEVSGRAGEGCRKFK